MNFTFLDLEHQNEFQSLRSELAESYRYNTDYLSVIFLMAGNPELNWKMHRHFDMIGGMLHDEDLFAKEDLSSGIKLLAQLAINLFNNNEKVNVLDLVGTLDDRMFELAINAIKLRRLGISKAYVIKSE